jgi:hypothetical protein
LVFIPFLLVLVMAFSGSELVSRSGAAWFIFYRRAVGFLFLPISAFPVQTLLALFTTGSCAEFLPPVVFLILGARVFPASVHRARLDSRSRPRISLTRAFVSSPGSCSRSLGVRPRPCYRDLFSRVAIRPRLPSVGLDFC